MLVAKEQDVCELSASNDKRRLRLSSEGRTCKSMPASFGATANDTQATIPIDD